MRAGAVGRRWHAGACALTTPCRCARPVPGAGSAPTSRTPAAAHLRAHQRLATWPVGRIGGVTCRDVSRTSGRRPRRALLVSTSRRRGGAGGSLATRSCRARQTPYPRTSAPAPSRVVHRADVLSDRTPVLSSTPRGRRTALGDPRAAAPRGNAQRISWVSHPVRHDRPAEPVCSYREVHDARTAVVSRLSARIRLRPGVVVDAKAPRCRETSRSPSRRRLASTWPVPRSAGTRRAVSGS